MWLYQSRSQLETYGTLKRRMKKSWIKGQFTNGDTELRKPTRNNEAPGINNHGSPTVLIKQEEGLVPGTWADLELYSIGAVTGTFIYLFI